MRRRDAVVAVVEAGLLLTGCVDRGPRWARSSAPLPGPTVTLPAPDTTGSVPLERALAGRRSVRTFAPAAVSRAQLSQLLWAAQGVTSADGRRAAPSAGRTYPLELYAVTATEVLHYLPAGHRAEVRASVDLRPALRETAHDQPAVTSAPLVVAVAAVAGRTAARYGARAAAFVEREVGHAVQNLLLEATVLGLAGVPIGSVDADAAARVLGLPPDRTVRYLVPVGRPG